MALLATFLRLNYKTYNTYMSYKTYKTNKQQKAETAAPDGRRRSALRLLS